MTGFVDRENEIFDVLQKFKDEGLEFVVVGGYGVSAYKHRFSVDADIVLKEDNLGKFTNALENQGFEKDTDKDLVYSGRYIAYVKDKELPVTIDLLVDELQCRQTSASWSYQYFKQNSKEEKIDGSQKSVKVPVPTKELLIAVKLHSGRLTDTRDVVALIKDANLNQVDQHIDRGDQEKFKQVLENIEQAVSNSNFEDSFKGVFSQGNLPEDQIQKLKSYIKDTV